MLPIFVLLFLLVIVVNTLTTIPFSIAVLVVCNVIFRKPWVFFAGLFLGLVLDLFSLRTLGQTPLMFTLFIFIVNLYERKFETQTLSFVFFTTFLGSFFYLWFFGYQMIFIQAFINALLSVLLFRVILSKAKDLDSSLRSE